jgi:hypothetical protein
VDGFGANTPHRFSLAPAAGGKFNSLFKLACGNLDAHER